MNLNSKILLDAMGAGLPGRISDKIKACLAEDEAYAADELVELGEEILCQIAAVGMAHYIRHAPHKEVYNDFLVQLFNGTEHEYNAGPLYRWAANMVRECPLMRQSGHFRFFWQAENGKEIVCDEVHHLAELRNQVMHGFFVLPPERNRQEADRMGALLQDLRGSGFFKNEGGFHFLGQDGFTGKWNIDDAEGWSKLINDSQFGKLCSRIKYEQSDDFWMEEQKALKSSDTALVPEELKAFVTTRNNGAFACWTHPGDKDAGTIYPAIGKWLQQQPGVCLVSYALHEQGISYTSGFLLQRLMQVLNEKKFPVSKNKKPDELVSDLRKKYSGKVVVLINNLHLALFSPQHVSLLRNFLFDNNILWIAVGHHYEHFNTFFNQSWTKKFPPSLPTTDQQREILHNYLRFKGPSIDKADECDDVMMLEEIMKVIAAELEQGSKVVARRFADLNTYDIEYVHEVFAMLHPWVNTNREPFEADAVDELYGFPTTMTEVTPIYLALGRRDLKLEYQHKVLSL